MKKIVLGSTSPYRKEILAKLNIHFETAKPNIDEKPQANETPEQLVARLAEQKAMAVQADFENALIIGSDQVAVFGDKILGKPHTEENAIKQLMSFSGQHVTFLTGLSVFDTATKEAKTLVEQFSVYFRQLTELEIRAYVKAEQPLNCAGSFKSEGLGICLFEKLVGDDPNTLIGLPLIKLCELFKRFGVNVLEHQSITE
ncbi:Maf family protein [Thalassotalea euphylliae]|uniref:Maf family protein n=1 Tax=Thalassotalea euphylliae TaxID=1655234 RepID=UPI00363FC6D7